MSEKKNTTKMDRRHQHQSWKMKEMFAAIQSWVTSEKKGTKQRKARWGRAGAKRRSRKKATNRSITKKRMTKSMMRTRRHRGQNARSGK